MTNKGKPLAVTGLIFQFGFLVGIAGTVIGMMRAFAEPAQGNSMSQEALADHMGLALYTTAGGLLVSFLGALLLLIALFGVKYRAPWFRVAMWVMSILWLFSIPIGTVIAIIVMIYLSKHKEEFTEPPSGAYRGPASGPANAHS